MSEEVLFATNWDLLIERSVLGYEAIAEIWNEGTVLIDQVVERLARLGTSTQVLLELHDAAIADSEPGAAIPTGVPVLSDADPRLRFQDAEAERVAAHWEPAMALAPAASLEEALQLRAEELELADDVAAELGLRDLASLERRPLDVANSVPTASLVEALVALRLGASAKLRGLVKNAYFATYVEPPPRAQATFARSRRGAGRRRDEPLPRAEAAARYANEVMELLEQRRREEEPS